LQTGEHERRFFLAPHPSDRSDTTRVKTAYGPETHHPRTGARRTNTLEAATPSRVKPPTPAQIQAEQQRTATEAIDRQGNLVNVGTQLALPLELTDKERRENLARNLATIGVRGASFIYFEGVKGALMVGEETLPNGRLYICLLRQTQIGFRRFNGPGGNVDIMMRGLDEPQLTRVDLPDGDEEEESQFGRRLRWQDYILLPMIDASGAGHERFASETRNLTSYWAARGLIGRCDRHPMFERGLSPIVELGVTPYRHKAYGMKTKPSLKICGWANPDGTTAIEKPTPKPNLSDEMNDELPI
jgi:hypothetical protein